MTLLFWVLLLLAATALAAGWSRYGRMRRHLDATQQALQSTQEQIDQFKHGNDLHQNTADKLRGYLRLMDALINTIPNPIYFKDAQGVFQGCNRVFAKQIIGLTRADIIGQRAQQLPDQIPADLAATCRREELKMIDKEREHNFEAPVLCSDGKTRDFMFSIAPVIDEDRELSGSVAILSDLTDKNRAALDRIQKEKLEGVLETAGAVCHEFNQPLQALSGFAELLSAQLGDENPTSDYLKKIDAQIERLQGITNNLQGITRYETTAYAGNTRIIDIHKASKKT